MWSSCHGGSSTGARYASVIPHAPLSVYGRLLSVELVAHSEAIISFATNVALGGPE